MNENRSSIHVGPTAAEIVAARTRVIMKIMYVCLVAALLSGIGNLTAQTAAPALEEAAILRVFEEPLEAMGSTTSQEETEALRAALARYAQSGRCDATESLEAFLTAYPESTWRASLRMNMGLALSRTGWPGKAMKNFEVAWKSVKVDPRPLGRRIADRAVTEWMWLCVKVGDDATLERLLRETKDRPMRGGSAQRRADAERALFAMQKEAKFYLCGPTALATVNQLLKPGRPVDPRDVKDTIPGPNGTSLFQLAMMASHWDIPLQMLKRDPGAKVLTPAVMHWKAGHWAAVLQEAGDRYLVQEDVLEEAIWVRREALDAETSGYCLAPFVPLPQGWSRVSAEEGRTIWGRGRVGLGPWYGPYPDSLIRPRLAPAPLVAQAGVRMGNLSLEVWQAPLSIPRHDGPAWPFEVRYQQRITWQPDRPNFSHLGQHWTFTGISYLVADESCERQDVQLFTESGTWLRFSGFDPITGRYTRNFHTRDLLVRLGSGRYELHRTEGTVETFDHSISVGPSLRRIFRSEQKSPSGQKLLYEFDDSDRLRSMRDGAGKGFTLHYEDPVDLWRLSRVVDNHGREARFIFDEHGQLMEIVDAAGRKTRLANPETDLEPDVLQRITTPEGSWRFEHGQKDLSRWVELVDPMGKRHRSEFCHDAAGLPTTDAEAPAGPLNQYMHDRGTYYWDPEALAKHRGNYAKSESIRYLFNPTQLALSWSLEAVKRADEPRIWFLFPGQTNTQVEGTAAQPRRIARKSGGVEQRWDLTWDERKGINSIRNERGDEAVWIDRKLITASTHLSRLGSSMARLRCDWDQAGLLTQVWNGRRLLWGADRDDRGNIRQVRDSKGKQWHLSYDDKGRWTGLCGRIAFHWSLDSLDRVATLKVGTEKAILFVYDGLDRVITGRTYRGGSSSISRSPVSISNGPAGGMFRSITSISEGPTVLPIPSGVRNWMDRGGSIMPAFDDGSPTTSLSRSDAINIAKWINLLRELEPPTGVEALTRRGGLIDDGRLNALPKK